MAAFVEALGNSSAPTNFLNIADKLKHIWWPALIREHECEGSIHGQAFFGVGLVEKDGWIARAGTTATLEDICAHAAGFV